MSEIQHPPWCEPALCTAKATPTLEEYRASVQTNYGRHVSAPVKAVGLELVAFKSVLPWATETFVQLGPALSQRPRDRSRRRDTPPAGHIIVAVGELVDALRQLDLLDGEL